MSGKRDTRTLAAWHRAVRHLFVGETRRERRERMWLDAFMRIELSYDEDILPHGWRAPESKSAKRHRAEMLRQVNGTPGAVWMEGMEAPVCPA